MPADMHRGIKLVKACIKPCRTAKDGSFPADYPSRHVMVGRNQLYGQVTAANVLGKCGGNVMGDDLSRWQHECIIMRVPQLTNLYNMKLFTTAASPYARKVRIVLAEKRIDCEIVMLASLSDPASPLPDHNPLGKVPTLVLDDGRSLYDSPVIAEYLDNKTPVAHLIPQEHNLRVDVRCWEALADGVCDAAVAVVMEKRRPTEGQDAALIERQMLKVTRGLETMSKELGEGKWCVDDVFSLADIAVGCALAYVNLRMPETGWQKAYPNLAKLYTTLAKRPSFVDSAPPT
jgi:glutathione S-transferase